jgi:hypothetical protein
MHSAHSRPCWPSRRRITARRRADRAHRRLRRSAGISQSMELTSTTDSTRSMPRGRTRHTTGTRTPPAHHHRRLRDTQAACAHTQTIWRASYALVLVSIANPRLVGATANESMSPCPRHASECRSRHRSRKRRQRPPYLVLRARRPRRCGPPATASGGLRTRGKPTIASAHTIGRPRSPLATLWQQSCEKMRPIRPPGRRSPCKSQHLASLTLGRRG